MSRSWRPTRLITAADLFGGRLEKHGVRERVVKQTYGEWAAAMGVTLPRGTNPDAQMEGTTERSRCLTDGTNCMWIEISKRGFVADITRYGDNDANDILKAIDEEFEAGLIDEEHPDYWDGYE